MNQRRILNNMLHGFIFIISCGFYYLPKFVFSATIILYTTELGFYQAPFFMSTKLNY